MIKNFEELKKAAAQAGPRTIAVAAAEDEAILQGVEMARKEGIINGILIGNMEKIEALCRKNHMSPSRYTIINEADKSASAAKAVELVREGNADLLMKGFLDTSVIMKAVLNKEGGLRTEGLLSHVGVLKIKGFDQFFVISDSAINIAPSLQDKVEIIRNAVTVAKALQIECPNVAVICPVEKVNTKIQSTVDAEELVRMNREGLIAGCRVGGPLALDNAVSLEAAKHKKVDDPVAGRADILIAPDLPSGNILNKSMEYFAQAEKAGIIMGARVSVVLTSRASSSSAKCNSIALGVLVEAKIRGRLP